MLIAAGAIWVELRPEPTVTHPFANSDIAPGAVVDETNTESRPVPAGTFDSIAMGLTALKAIRLGEPILPGDVGDPDQTIPAGWWVIEVPLPREAPIGAAARLVLLDSGEVVEGVVVTAAVDDPLGSGLGLIAVEPERAADAARATAEGRVAVMIAAS